MKKNEKEMKKRRNMKEMMKEMKRGTFFGSRKSLLERNKKI
jgi:hypothetical protein